MRWHYYQKFGSTRRALHTGGHYDTGTTALKRRQPGKKTNNTGENFVGKKMEDFDFKTRSMGESGHFNPCKQRPQQ
jgi:hypothetical protein